MLRLHISLLVHWLSFHRLFVLFFETRWTSTSLKCPTNSWLAISLAKSEWPMVSKSLVTSFPKLLSSFSPPHGACRRETIFPSWWQGWALIGWVQSLARLEYWAHPKCLIQCRTETKPIYSPVTILKLLLSLFLGVSKGQRLCIFNKLQQWAPTMLQRRPEFSFYKFSQQIPCSDIHGVQILFFSFSSIRTKFNTWNIRYGGHVYLCKMDRTKIKHMNQLEIAQNEIWTPRKFSLYTVCIASQWKQ